MFSACRDRNRHSSRVGSRSLRKHDEIRLDILESRLLFDAGSGLGDEPLPAESGLSPAEALVVDSGTVTVSSDMTVTPGALASLAIASGAADGTVSIGAAGILAVTGDVTVGAGGTLEIDGALAAGAVNVTGGSLTNSRNSAADIALEGDVTLADGGVLVIDVINGSVDTLVTDGSVTLGADASLEIVIVGGGKEFAGGTYTLIRAGDGLSGTFANVTDLGRYVSVNGNGLAYDPVGGTVTLTLDMALSPGDGNLDGRTDVSDRIIWNNNNFTSGTTFATGDWNNDGRTDVSDRIIWNNNNFAFATPRPSDSDSDATDTHVGGSEARGLEYFVSVSGDDNGEGTFEDPLASLSEARDRIRVLKTSGFDGAVTVYVREGTYWLDETFELTPQDSGSLGNYITYQAYPGEEAVLSGGQIIHGSWEVYGSGIYVMDVSGFIDRYGSFNSLFVDAEWATRARTPNEGFHYIDGVDAATRSSAFRFRSGDIDSSWRNLEEVEVVAYRKYVQSRYRIESVVGNTVNFAGNAAANFVKYDQDYDSTTGRYFVENVFEGLDSPGEWYLDKNTRELYYYALAGTDIDSVEIIAPVLNTIWDSSASNVNISGFTFSYADWELPIISGFTFSYADWELPIEGYAGFFNAEFVHDAAVNLNMNGGSFTDNVISKTGGNGLRSTSYDFDITGNEITDVGAGGIRIDQGSSSYEYRDKSGHNNDGAHMGEIQKESFIGDAVSFDGDYDYIEVGDSNSLSTFPSGFTIGLWLKSDDMSGSVPLSRLSHWNAGDDKGGYGFYKGRWLLGNRTDWFGVSAGALSDGNWHYYALTWDGAEVISYRDDVQISSMASTDLTFPSYRNKLSLGRESRGSQYYFDGSMDEVMIYDRMLTADELLDTYSRGSQFMKSNITDGLVAYWDFESDETKDSYNQTISNNLVHDNNRVYRGASGIYLGLSGNNAISHNSVYNMTHCGITAFSTLRAVDSASVNNVIEYNDIHHVMTEMNDGGGIYIQGKQPGTIIRNNKIWAINVTSLHLHDRHLYGIYLDRGSMGITIKNNLVYQAYSGALLLHQSFDTVVENNLFIDSSRSQLVFAGTDRVDDTLGITPRGNRFVNNIVYYESNEASVFSEYQDHSIAVSDYNLYFNSGATENTNWNLDWWNGLGFDENSLTEDPLFVDYDNEDFTLRANSPVFALGFDNLDFSDVGC